MLPTTYAKLVLSLEALEFCVQYSSSICLHQRHRVGACGNAEGLGLLPRLLSRLASRSLSINQALYPGMERINGQHYSSLIEDSS